ncbi:hypothetical protein BgAZ_402360 [Babesia gibsoni]|uniref:Uncharacterized protein n=1 Tax=Babesia gibsoni TaxID=33632 RepID=A0AAD8LN43_BABGI|nr:hypothetical protein BgAZ_402360 [Babesia gibsoni]
MEAKPSSTLHKLRFMQKSDQQEVRPAKVAERLLDQETVWIAEGFEHVHNANNVEQVTSNKNLKISYPSRKSFNGANPFIENYIKPTNKRR